jgi:hypothetical protein
MSEVSRERYALLYGPTAGDRIRLADTSLLIEVERDLCAGGDEAVFGGGKVIRESMGQAVATRAEGTPDLVITGAVILDHWGIVKADVGIRDGRITAIGKAGNPDIMDGVHPDLVIGPSTEVMAGNGLILTAGAIDCHGRLPPGRDGRRRADRDPHRHAERGRVRRGHPGRDRGPPHPRVPHRGRRRRARAGHHHGRLAAERAALLDQPDQAAHGQHGRRAP